MIVIKNIRNTVRRNKFFGTLNLYKQYPAIEPEQMCIVPPLQYCVTTFPVEVCYLGNIPLTSMKCCRQENTYIWLNMFALIQTREHYCTSTLFPNYFSLSYCGSASASLCLV